MVYNSKCYSWSEVVASDHLPAPLATGKGKLQMKLREITLVLIALLVVAGTLSAESDDEIEAFVQEIIKDARTDSQRSTLLMGAVSLAEGNSKLKIALLERAVQYGIKSLRTVDDCRKFQGILTDLARSDPGRKAHWLSRKAAVYRRWCTLSKSSTEKRQLAEAAVAALTEAGGASAAKGQWKKASSLFNEAKVVMVAYRLPNPNRLAGYIRSSSYLSRVQDKIAGNIETLEKTPDDLDARSNLVTMLVTAMNDPVEAMKYVNEDVDERFRIFVPMAVKDISEQSVDACKNLGDWYYKELSKSPVAVVKYRMLGRAKVYYERTLKLHTGADVMSAALKLSLSQIKSDLAKLGNVDPLVCSYCFGTGKMPCKGCTTNGQATGLRKCHYCKGAGRGKCRSCGGTWRLKCSRCSGRGKVASGKVRRGGVYYKKYSKCRTCSGSGIMHRSRYGSSRSGPCSTCSKQKAELRGTSVCPYCNGRGGSGTCSTCRGAKTAMCTHCTAGKAVSPFGTDTPRRKASSRPSRRPPSSTRRLRD